MRPSERDKAHLCEIVTATTIHLHSHSGNKPIAVMRLDQRIPEGGIGAAGGQQLT
jgi:hypothetical protein